MVWYIIKCYKEVLMKVFEVIIKNETAATCIQRFSVASFKMDKSGWNQSRKKMKTKTMENGQKIKVIIKTTTKYS